MYNGKSPPMIIVQCANTQSLRPDYRTITNPTSSLEFPSPSTAAEYKRYAELQTKPETTIYDGSYHFKHPVDTAALPITIYHPVFQSFAENITTAKPDKELLANVCKWMKTLTAVGSRKEPLTADLRDALSKILVKPIEQFVVDGTIPDGVARAARSDITIPLLVMEYKPALGEGGCDPLTQASHSVWKFWRRVNVCTINLEMSGFEAFMYNSYRKSAIGPVAQPSSSQAADRTWQSLGLSSQTSSLFSA